MRKSAKRPFVAVDTDTMIFQAAAVCEERSIEVTHTPTGIVKSFKNRTEFKELMKSKDKPITDAYSILDIQDPQPFSHVAHTLKSGAERILDNFKECEVVFCAGAENNFRDALPYPTRYKANRDKMIRPVHLKQAQEYFRRTFKSIKAIGHETDDEIAIQTYAQLQKGRDAFILSPDGDSRQFDGIKLGNYLSTPDNCVDVKLMHPVTWDKDDFQSYGFPWMVMQCLVGDASDGLNPTALSGVKYGVKSAYKDMKDFTAPEQFAEFLVQKYKQWFPEPYTYMAHDGTVIRADWKHALDLYWKGVVMKRDKRLPNFWVFTKEKGITLDTGLV